MITKEQLQDIDKKLQLTEQLIEASLLHNTTPSTNIPNGTNGPFGMITPSLNVQDYSTERLHLLHTMLHLFHSSKSGKNLNDDDIVKLHSQVKERLSSHKVFDKLDRE